MPVPPVRMTTCTRASAQASCTMRATSAGSSRTIVEPTTPWPAPARSSRISAPLVSVSGVLVSETVSTKQPTAFGAVALCSRGVEAASRSGMSVGAIEHFHEVQHRDVETTRAETGMDLENAAGVRGDDGLGTRRLDVAHLASQQAVGHLGLREVVDAGRAATPVGLRQVHDAQRRHLRQEVARLAANLLAV